MAYSPSPSFINVTPSNPGAISSATYQMCGLGVAGANAFTITPQITGRVLVVVTDNVTGTSGQTVTMQLSQGTGAAPANAAAVTGTQFGSQVTSSPLTGELLVPFALVAVVTDLAVPSVNSLGVTSTAVAVWLDVALKQTTGTAAALTNLQCVAVEI